MRHCDAHASSYERLMRHAYASYGAAALRMPRLQRTLFVRGAPATRARYTDVPCHAATRGASSDGGMLQQYSATLCALADARHTFTPLLMFIITSNVATSLSLR